MFELTIEQRVATVVLARAPVNAISMEWGAAFAGLLDALEQRDDWAVLHLRSEQKVFSAGADLGQIEGWIGAAEPGRELAGYIAALQAVFRRLETLSRVTLAEIGGAALGGGFELALCCDLRIAADEARLGLPEVGIGLIPGLGGTQRLTRLCGPGVARRIILGTEAVDGQTARSLGMVQWSVPRADLAEAARTTSRQIAARSLPALKVAKSLIEAAAHEGDSGFALEREMGGGLLHTAEAREAITAFIDRSRSRKA